MNHNSSNQRGQTSGQGREKRKERPEGGGIKELPSQEARHASEERLLRKLGLNAERYSFARATRTLVSDEITATVSDMPKITTGVPWQGPQRRWLRDLDGLAGLQMHLARGYHGILRGLVHGL